MRDMRSDRLNKTTRARWGARPIRPNWDRYLGMVFVMGVGGVFVVAALAKWAAK